MCYTIRGRLFGVKGWYVVQTNGYHGTTKENAEKILLECKFIDSNKNNEWLGIRSLIKTSHSTHDS